MVQFSCVSIGQHWFSCVSALVQLWLSLVGTSGVGLVQVWLRFSSDLAQVWCAAVCGLSLCGSALVQLWFRFVWPYGSRVQVRF